MPSFRQAFSPFFLKKLFDPRHVLDCTAQLDYGFADTNCAIRPAGRQGRRGVPAAGSRGRRNGTKTVRFSLTRWNSVRLSCRVVMPSQGAVRPAPQGFFSAVRKREGFRRSPHRYSN